MMSVCVFGFVVKNVSLNILIVCISMSSLVVSMLGISSGSSM